jgi:hypothetical protein
VRLQTLSIEDNELFLMGVLVVEVLCTFAFRAAGLLTEEGFLAQVLETNRQWRLLFGAKPVAKKLPPANAPKALPNAKRKKKPKTAA